jgi:hypothetical protein
MCKQYHDHYVVCMCVRGDVTTLRVQTQKWRSWDAEVCMFSTHIRVGNRRMCKCGLEPKDHGKLHRALGEREASP